MSVKTATVLTLAVLLCGTALGDWRERPALPDRIGPGGCAVAGRGHVFAAASLNSEDWYAFDVARNKWIQMEEDLPVPVGTTGAIAYETGDGMRLFMVSREGDMEPDHKLYAYRFSDVAGLEGKWEAHISLPAERCNIGAGASLAFRPDTDGGSLLSGWLYLLPGGHLSDLCFWCLAIRRLENTPERLNMDEEQGAGLDQQLDWVPTGLGDDYQVQVARDSDFATILLDRTLTLGELSIPQGQLLLGNTYYWRVRTRHDSLDGPWSGTRRLAITNQAAAPAIASYPPDGAVIASSNPVFDWPSVEGATGYELRVVSTTGTVALDTVVSASECFGATPLERGRYTWTTRPVLAGGSVGAWSGDHAVESDYGWKQLDSTRARVGRGTAMCYAPAYGVVPEVIYELRGDSPLPYDFEGYDIASNTWDERRDTPSTVNAGTIVMREDNPNLLYALFHTDGDFCYVYNRTDNRWLELREPIPCTYDDGSSLSSIGDTLFLTAARDWNEPNFYSLVLTGEGGGTQSVGPAPAFGEPAVAWHRARAGIIISLGSPASGRLCADVYDLTGRSVRTLGTTVTGSGPCELYWDATSRTETRVAPGVYFVSVRSADATHRVKVVLQ